MIGKLTGMLAAAAALMAAAPASAQILWDRVDAGMSAEAARARYPAGGRTRHRGDRITLRDHEISGQCRADVHIHHEGGSVGRVVMRGEPAIAGRCGLAILEVLAARYGQPESQIDVAAGLTSRGKTVYSWTQNGVTLRYTRYSTAGYGGSGLGNASWELVYSTGEAGAAGAVNL